MSEFNNVTVVFRNGDEMEVNQVARLVGADWVTAGIVRDYDDADDELEMDYAVLHTDDIRCIISETVDIGERESNFRIHRSKDSTDDIMFDAWMGQHQLHPDADPSAYEGSEKQWPPSGGDPRYQESNST